MKKINSLMTLIASLVFMGCAGKLATPGAYNGDTFLFRADQTITTSYDLLNGFVKWEQENRPALKGTPEVAEFADYVRSRAKQWIQIGQNMRDAYKANPSQENKNALEVTLRIIRRALAEAAGYMAPK